MTTKKTTKKTAAKKPAKKAAAKKAPAKKVAKKPAVKKAPSPKKALQIKSTSESNVIKPATSGAVIYASEIKNPSLRDRVFAWFKN
jgi:hypothetical protein